MKSKQSKATNPTAYGALQPFVEGVFLLSLIGSIISLVASCFSIYLNTEGWEWYRWVNGVGGSLFLEGTTRLFIYLSCFMAFLALRAYEHWKVLLAILSAAAGFFFFQRNLNTSMEGSDKFAEIRTEKTDSIFVDHTDANLKAQMATKTFDGDSLNVIARINKEAEQKIIAAKARKSAALKERSRLQNAPDNNGSDWFVSKIKNQTNIIVSANETIKNINKDKATAVSYSLDSLRGELAKSESEALAMQLNNETKVDSVNQANHDLYLSQLNENKSEFAKYIWAALLLNIIHSVFYFYWLLVSGVTITWEFTKEDDIELPSLYSQLSSAMRFKAYKWKYNRLKKLITGDVEVIVDGLNVTFMSKEGDVEEHTKEGTYKKKHEKAMMDYSEPEPLNTSPTPSPVEEEKQEIPFEVAMASSTTKTPSMEFETEQPTPVPASTPVRPIGFHQNNEPPQKRDKPTLTEKDIDRQVVKRVGEGLEAIKKEFNDTLENYKKSVLQSFKTQLETKEREHQQQIRALKEQKEMDEKFINQNFKQLRDDLRQANKTIEQLSQNDNGDKIAKLERDIIQLRQQLNETKPEPVTNTEKVTTHRIETVTEFNPTDTKRTLKKYMTRFEKSWTEAKQNMIEKCTTDLVHHGYHVELEWLKSFDVSRTKSYKVGEKKAEITIKRDGEKVQNMTIKIVNA